jgi:glycerophosphoryl diester phosphodiesterase
MREIFFLMIAASSSIFAQSTIPRFDIQGHRGARGVQPENTIPAFIAGLDSGVTTLEMDVVITKDKLVVVSHEPWMSAAFCTDSLGHPVTEKNEKKLNIYKMTYEQVRKFDCGLRGNKKFPDQAKISVSKPLLRDVILAVENHIKNFSRYEVDYSIEIKSEKGAEGKFQPAPDEFSDLVYDLIDQYLPLDRVVIQSFDFRVLQYWHNKHPEVRLAALVENLKSIDENINELGFRPSIYSPDYKLLDKDEVKHCHALSMRMIPWTVNEVPDMLELKNWNVDGIITDYPALAGKYRRTLNIKVR